MLRRIIALTITAAALGMAALTGHGIGAGQASAADFTIAPCSMHTLPAYTDTVHCVAADGSITLR